VSNDPEDPVKFSLITVNILNIESSYLRTVLHSPHLLQHLHQLSPHLISSSMTSAGAATPSPPNVNRRPRILLGITGSVAAVKGPRLVLRLAREVKADVKVILTRTVEKYFWKEDKAVASYDIDSWREFITATTSSISSAVVNNVTDSNDEQHDDWRESEGRISLHYSDEEWINYTSLQDTVLHIDMRNWADICLIAPLSAHTLAKIANGLCDDLLSCCIRAWDFGQISAGKPVILAPAMNTGMWYHPLTKNHIDTIRSFSKDDTGVVIVEPGVKILACGEVGVGALAELDLIIHAVTDCLMNNRQIAQSEQDVSNTMNCGKFVLAPSSITSSTASSRKE